MKMKKVITLVLCAVMLLTLCACGKSKEAQNVDNLILAIGEVSIDSAEKIAVAEEAYDALSDKDKSKVENYSILNDAEASLRKMQFNNEYADLVERLKSLNHKSQKVYDTTYQLWINSAGAFDTNFQCVRMLQSEEGVNFWREELGKSSFNSVVLCARCAVTGEELTLDVSDEEKEAVIEKCIEYNTFNNSVQDESKQLDEDVDAFGKKYGSDFSEEFGNLSDWCIESSLYVEFTMTPSGTMSNYANRNREYDEKLSRFQKIAKSYVD